MGEPAEKWNKAERLAVAGAVAPALRSQSDRAARRRVAKIDKDGNVVGYTTLAEVQQALLERHRIEIAVQPDQRPKEKPCDQCGIPIPVGRSGKLKTKCESCYFGRCSTCGVIKKERRSNMCKPCAIRSRHGFLPGTTPCSGCGKALKRRTDRKQAGSRCVSCYHRERIARKAYCPKGHELTGDNLVLRRRRRGLSRACRACTNANASSARARRRGGPPLSRTEVAAKSAATRRKRATESNSDGEGTK